MIDYTSPTGMVAVAATRQAIRFYLQTGMILRGRLTNMVAHAGLITGQTYSKSRKGCAAAVADLTAWLTAHGWPTEETPQ